MANITTTTAATHIPEVWVDESMVIDAYDKAVILRKLVDSSYQKYVKGVHGGGDIINVPKRANLTASTQTVDQDATLSANTEGNLAITFATWDVVGTRVDDKAKLQIMPGYFEGLDEDMGIALGTAVDTAIATNFASLTNGKGTLGQALSLENYIDAEETLLTNDVPTDLEWFTVIGPRDRTKWIQEELLINKDYNIGKFKADAGPGYLGPVYMSQCYMSNNLVASGSGRHGVLMTRRSLYFVEGRPVYIDEYRDARQGSWERYARIIFGTGIARDTDGGVKLLLK